MRKVLYLCSFCILGLFACSKESENPNTTPAKNMTEVLARISAVSTWKVNQITVNGKITFDNGVPLDPDFDGVAEWIKFDASKKKVEVKYLDGDEISVFDFVVDEAKKTLTVVDESGTEEILVIKAGSVFADKFELETVYDDEVQIVKLIPKI